MRKYLKELRERKELSQLEVSQKLEISESYYSLIESGERQKKMSLDLAQKLSELFDIPIDIIFKNERNGG